MIQCPNCKAGFTREEMITIYEGKECMGCNNGKYEKITDEKE